MHVNLCFCFLYFPCKFLWDYPLDIFSQIPKLWYVFFINFLQSFDKQALVDEISNYYTKNSFTKLWDYIIWARNNFLGREKHIQLERI